MQQACTHDISCLLSHLCMPRKSMTERWTDRLTLTVPPYLHSILFLFAYPSPSSSPSPLSLPSHQVIRKLLKTYGHGLRDTKTLPLRPSISVSKFLAKKFIKTALVFGIFSFAFVVAREKRWKNWIPWLLERRLAMTFWIAPKTTSG